MWVISFMEYENIASWILAYGQALTRFAVGEYTMSCKNQVSFCQRV